MEPATMSYAQLREAYQALQEQVIALQGAAAVQAPVGSMRRSTRPAHETVIVPDACLVGGGEMGARMRAMDWGTTSLGPVATWPQSVRTAVGICLTSRYPMVIWWGQDCLLLYNDAWCPLISLKHPTALGRPGREVFPEVWEVIGPMLESVLATGQATWSDDGLLLQRYGYTEAERQRAGALKFTFKGEIAVTLRPAGEAVALAVRDTGIGIPAAEIPHLVERFHRVEGACGRPHEGTGISPAFCEESGVPRLTKPFTVAKV
jgi:Histidine kinase-, DNA gyrase B-, and HSP90-like ATPase